MNLLKEEIPHLRQATEKHIQMCCCETCLVFEQMHEQLKLFRRQRVNLLERMVQEKEKNLSKMISRKEDCSSAERAVENAKRDLKDCQECAIPNKQPQLQKASEALTEVFSQPVQVACVEAGFMYKWKCVLGKCTDCSQKKTFINKRALALKKTTSNFSFTEKNTDAPSMAKSLKKHAPNVQKKQNKVKRLEKFPQKMKRSWCHVPLANSWKNITGQCH